MFIEITMAEAPRKVWFTFLGLEYKATHGIDIKSKYEESLNKEVK
jgi:hypothetical protein